MAHFSDSGNQARRLDIAQATSKFDKFIRENEFRPKQRDELTEEEQVIWDAMIVEREPAQWRYQDLVTLKLLSKDTVKLEKLREKYEDAEPFEENNRGLLVPALHLKLIEYYEKKRFRASRALFPMKHINVNAVGNDTLKRRGGFVDKMDGVEVEKEEVDKTDNLMEQLTA